MRAISTGSTYKIFDDTLRTYEKLPVQTYVVRFDRQTGFYLEKYVDISIPEEKIYGVHIEICAGETFKSAIRDLNIINLYEERYEVSLLFKNGYKVSKGHTSLDLFGGDVYDINFHDARYNDICTVYFSIKNSTYDLQLGGNIIPAEQLEIVFEEDKDLPREALKAKQAGVSHLLIRRKQARNLHYAV